MNRTFLKYLFATIIWMAVIAWMSSGTFSKENTSLIITPVLTFLFPGLSAAQVDFLHEAIRKLAHVFEYFILGFLLFQTFRGNSQQKWSLKWAIYAIAVGALYALSDEAHQLFVPSRSASLIDAGIDTAGGVFSQVVIMVRARK